MTGGGGKKRARVEEEEAEAEAEALECLTTVPLKLAAVLYAATDGGALENVPRETLLAPLEAIGCDNASNATQLNRVIHYQVAHWFAHNKERGSEAAIGLTRDGVEAIHDLFIAEDDKLDQEALDTLTRAIKKATVAQAAAAPLSQRKQPRAAPSPAAAEAAEEVEVEARVDGDEQDVPETEEEESDEEEDKDVSIRALQQRVDALARKFDERVNRDALAAAYGDLAADFLKTKGRVPTSREGDALLREAQDTIYGEMELGDGKVTHTELCEMFQKLEAASKLVGEVMDLEARALAKAK